MGRLLIQELRQRRNAVLLWGAGLCFFPIVYLGIYPQTADEMQGLADLEIYQTMGVSLGGLEEWIGSILVLFVPLVLSIYAVINGTGTLAGEEEDGRLELIVTLPLPRWQIVTAKALALGISLLIILVVVSLVSVVVFLSIENQVETELIPWDVFSAMLSTWPLLFAVGMLSMFLASFAARRRIASILAAVIVIVSYFGSNLASTTSALEPFEPFFLFTYLDATRTAVTKGQQATDVLTLVLIGIVSLGLTLFFFHRRKLTVGAWPWQRTPNLS